MPNYRFDHAEWREVKGGAELSYNLRYDYKLLGWDFKARTVDFVLHFAGDGGHCQRHRHLADTTILVLEGEQHLNDLLQDGSTVHKTRVAGAYSRSTGPDAHPHMERGGLDGALIFYGCHAPDGRLFEFLDDDLNVTTVVTIEYMIERWEVFRASQTLG